MRNKKMHTPIGVRDFLPDEFAFKTELEKKIITVFHRYGYHSVSSPGFEFVEVFETGAGSRDIYKFIDDKGNVLALRSDMTPPIARIAASSYTNEDLPLRLCYSQNTFRQSENYKGKLREFTQAGIELIGSRASEAHGEVVAVAINSLLTAGLSDFRIDMGQVEFLQGLLEEAALPVETEQRIQQLMIKRDFVSVKEIVNGENIQNGIKGFFTELPLMIGGKRVLEKAKEFTSHPKCLNALQKLEEINEFLCDCGFEQYISFDLTMLGHLDYYTGLIFRGYTNGVGTSVIDGGQYDTLFSQFGADYPAVGFAIKINFLMTALLNAKAKMPDIICDTLLAYAKTGREAAFKTADNLRSSGLCVENSLMAGDLDKSIAYADRKKMGGVIYFFNDEDIRLINLKTKEAVDVKISELYETEEEMS